MPENAPSRFADVLLFARNFVRHPRMLGSIIPSSRFLIKQVLEPIDWERARVIVEYGPGVGNITAEILRHMRPDGHVLAIETNRDFVHYLQSALPDPRLHLVQGSAADVDTILAAHGWGAASYIISGIPFSTMPDTLRTAIVRKSRAVLEPGGAFLVYQFSSRVLPDLQRTFEVVKRGFQPFNVLPAHLFEARRGSPIARPRQRSREW
jgi:phospholipid N-methyltransferase